MDAARFDSADCLHCGTRLVGAHCHVCGQKRAQRLAFGRLLRDGWAKVLDLDLRFPRTLVHLVRDPGGLARRYVDGERVTWSNPLFVLVVIATLYAFLIHAFDVPLISPFGQQSANAARSGAGQILAVLGYLMVLALVPAAWAQARVLRRHGPTAAECYVLLVNAYSLQLLVALVLIVTGALHTPAGWGVFRVAQILILVWATVRFVRSRHWTVWLAAVLAWVVALLALFLLGGSVIFLAWRAGRVDLPGA